MIFVNEDGLKQFEDLISKLHDKINKNNQEKKEAMEDAPGDGWHDNFAAEDAARGERMLLDELEKMLITKKLLRLVDNKFIKGKVNIGDTFKIIFDKDDNDFEIVTLSGNYLSVAEGEITLNSPLGKAVYHKKYNSDQVAEVNGNKLHIRICEI